MDKNVADPSQYGQVRVMTVNKNGVTSLVVQVPGTEDWSTQRGTNVVDMTTNVQAMAQNDTILRQQVIDAIELAKAEYPDADVMLTGHSQGGIVAATIAADSDTVQRFGITSLVTGGSPIGRMPIDPNVSVLSVEHTQDPVPMLDGTGNPDQPNWTTVRYDLPASEIKPDTVSPTAAHDTKHYVNTGGKIDASDDPTLQAWREDNAKFFDGEVKSTIYAILPDQKGLPKVEGPVGGGSSGSW